MIKRQLCIHNCVCAYAYDELCMCMSICAIHTGMQEQASLQGGLAALLL